MSRQGGRIRAGRERAGGNVGVDLLFEARLDLAPDRGKFFLNVGCSGRAADRRAGEKAARRRI
jgi:hypothetical protein